MSKVFESLERLAMPDALHTKVCKKLGISLTQDYDIVKLALLELEAIKEAKPSKATKALDRIYQSRSTNKTVTKDYEIIKQALQRLEQINNASPSEALECLKVLEDCASVCGDYSHRVEPIKQYILKAQEDKKVLEIIREKCLHNDNLNYVAVCINYDMYKELMSKKYDNEVVKINWNDKVLLDYLKLLKEEEFDLLKEVF